MMRCYFLFVYLFLPSLCFYSFKTMYASHWLKGMNFFFFKFLECALLLFITTNSDNYLLEGGATDIRLITASC